MSKKPFMELTPDQQAEFMERLGLLVDGMVNELPGPNKIIIIVRTAAPEQSQADGTLIYYSTEKDPVEAKNMLTSTWSGMSQYSNNRN